MIILGIDSSFKTASVGILEDDKVIVSYTLNHKRTHSEKLLEMIDMALKIAKLDEVINSLPEKENTYLSETFRLSEGQEQRLAIARAVYSKAPVIILDEPTSALDETTEKEVVKSLCDLDRTLIIISHKPAFENSVTKTAVISGGKLI